MRTDPTLQSVLQAYVTALIAADWRIDPRGASPEAVALCADSLGIPVQNEDPAPGAVRRRGVEWSEHIRLASLHLVFGHFPFEPVYELREGRAMLLALPERMPNTIIDIKTNDDGSLKSIVQEGRPGQRTSLNGGVEIPADRLLWYVHDREGASWQGRSLLRSAYSHWLLKLDTLRVNAIGIARFGAGTPVAEPLPGFTAPTPAQMTEAQRMVSSIRVGEQGGAVPLGFTLKIKGVEGTLPDALPTLRYYDEQMARAALTSLLDLGSTSNGSRALGSEFADVMTRALNSVADRMAKTGTQLCERLVTFNYGDSAAVPAVVAGDVGASPATIAASITQLITAGAVTPDPELEAYVRDAYHLPPKAAVAAVEPVPAAEPAPLRVAAAGGADRNRGNAEQLRRAYLHGDIAAIIRWGTDGDHARCVAIASKHMTVEQAHGYCNLREKEATGRYPAQHAHAVRAAAAPREYREPTDAEQAAGMDPQQIDEEHDALVALGVSTVAALVAAWGAALVAGIVAALTGGGLAALAKLTITRTGRVEVAVRALMEHAQRSGAEQVLDEVTRAGADHGLTVDDVIEGARPLDAEAEALVAQAASDLEAAAGREALRLADGQGDVTNESAQDIAEQVIETVTTGPSSPGSAQSPLVEQAVTRAMGGGRVMAMRKVIEATPELGWVVFASAIRDQATCEPCAEHDGTVYADLRAGRKDFPGGNYAPCLGRRRCRCILCMRPASAPAPVAGQ